MVEEILANLEMFAAVASTGVALLMAVVSFISWWRLRNPRALYITLAFVFFVVKGLYVSITAYRLRATREDWILWTAVLDLVVLLMLYMAIRRR
jgi:uncharacterized membrane protein YfcA